MTALEVLCEGPRVAGPRHGHGRGRVHRRQHDLPGPRQGIRLAHQRRRCTLKERTLPGAEIHHARRPGVSLDLTHPRVGKENEMKSFSQVGSIRE